MINFFPNEPFSAVGNYCKGAEFEVYIIFWLQGLLIALQFRLLLIV